MKPQALRALLVSVLVVILGGLIALAGSQGGATLRGFPLFALAVLGSFAVQWVVYVPSSLAQTEKYFDLTGSLTYVSITGLLLFLTPHVGPRSLVLGVLIIVWALRLGPFLFVRTRRAGQDDRFDKLKRSKLRFFMIWTVQGLWVTLTAAAAWIAITSSAQTGIDAFLIAGTALWAAGFACEVVADLQKTRFKADPANTGRFITTGLWSRSRHPNYFGEIVLWLGVAIAAFPALSGWGYLGLLSPLFVIVLLTKVSGIPLLEAKAQRNWGDEADYQAYRSQTPVLIPKIW